MMGEERGVRRGALISYIIEVKNKELSLFLWKMTTAD